MQSVRQKLQIVHIFPFLTSCTARLSVAVQTRRLRKKLLLPWHVKNVIYLDLACLKLLNLFFKFGDGRRLCRVAGSVFSLNQPVA